MKTGNFGVWVSVVLFAATASQAGTQAAGKRGYIGIRMDSAPLPRLLGKHLGLAEGQGVRIQNVGAGTPADKAGLERDDIIIEFEGRPVRSGRELAKSVQELEVGTEVTLEIIHIGKRKTVRLKLGSFSGQFKPKYPPEPGVIEPLDPERLFRFRPGDEWPRVEPGGPHGQLDIDIDRFSNELYTYNYSKDGRTCMVIIKGDPEEEDAELIVWVDGDRRETTVGRIKDLPEKHRQAAEQALKNAQRTAKSKGHRPGVELPPVPRRFPDTRPWMERHERDWPGRLPVPRFELREDVFERLGKQLRQLQERVRELEEKLRDKVGPANKDGGQDEGADTTACGSAEEDQMV